MRDRDQPSLIYRIAYTDWSWRERANKVAYERHGLTYDATPSQNAWDAFAKFCAVQFPNSELKAKPITLRAIAGAAGMGHYYESVYGHYSTYMHADIEVVMGDIAVRSDPYDNGAVALGALMAIGAVERLGAASPNFQSLHSRVFALIETTNAGR